jgi:hypothetical protein
MRQGRGKEEAGWGGGVRGDNGVGVSGMREGEEV